VTPERAPELLDFDYCDVCGALDDVLLVGGLAAGTHILACGDCLNGPVRANWPTSEAL
jgi:hypothetical protein